MIVRLRVAVAPCLALLLLLAGCAAPPSATTEQRLQEISLEHVAVETGASMGGIRGVVVDEDIRPVAGAKVVVRGVQGGAMTGADGIFAVHHVPAGLTFIDVEATGFVATRTAIEVVAGQPSEARLLLAKDPAPMAYHETIKYDGRLLASLPLATYVLDIALIAALDQSYCACLLRFDAADNVTTMVFEMDWTPATPTPGSETMYYQFRGNGDCASGRIEGEFSPPPILARYERSGWDGCNSFQVHYGGSALGPNVDQPFVSYVTLWSGGEPPERWSVVRGDG